MRCYVGFACLRSLLALLCWLRTFGYVVSQFMYVYVARYVISQFMYVYVARLKGDACA
jgi:hypothetical protein